MYVCVSYIIGTPLSSDSNGIVHLQGKSETSRLVAIDSCLNYVIIIIT